MIGRSLKRQTSLHLVEVSTLIRPESPLRTLWNIFPTKRGVSGYSNPQALHPTSLMVSTVVDGSRRGGWTG